MGNFIRRQLQRWRLAWHGTSEPNPDPESPEEIPSTLSDHNTAEGGQQVYPETSSMQTPTLSSHDHNTAEGGQQVYPETSSMQTPTLSSHDHNTAEGGQQVYPETSSMQTPTLSSHDHNTAEGGQQVYPETSSMQTPTLSSHDHNTAEGGQQVYPETSSMQTPTLSSHDHNTAEGGQQVYPETSSMQTPTLSSHDHNTAEGGQQVYPETSSMQTPTLSSQSLRPVTSPVTVTSARASSGHSTVYETKWETVNFFLIARLILDVCNGAMRDLMRSKITGGEQALTERIARRKTDLASCKLSQYQKQNIFSSTVKYESLDFTLMYTLVRNVFHEEIEPNSQKNCRWGKIPRAYVGDKSLLAAIETIRVCRNMFFAHATSSNVSRTTFNEIWTNIEGAVDTIDNNIDPSVTTVCYKKEMKKLKTSPTDPNHRNCLQEKLEDERKLNDLLEMAEETSFRIRELLANNSKDFQNINFGNPLLRRRSKRQEHTRREKKHLMNKEEEISDMEENPYKKDIFDEWKDEDYYFVSTRAAEEVERRIENQNLVIVTGHSGSGKSTIIQHIALKYKKKGWNVKPVDMVKEIKESYESGRFTEDKTLFVLNDPFGKDSFDDIEYQIWKKVEKTIFRFLKKVKIFMSCRKDMFYQISRVFEECSTICIDDHELKLNRSEKRKMFLKYTENKEIIESTVSEIMKIEMYFPLLCTLYAKQIQEGNTLRLFTEPVHFFESEITKYRQSDKGLYCALVCLIFFNNKLCLDDLEDEKNENLFRTCLRLCGIPESTLPVDIIEKLETLIGIFIKKVGQTYYFYHDLMMEVTTFVIGTNHLVEIIKHADISFLRKKLKLQSNSGASDMFSVLVKKEHFNNLTHRFLKDVISRRFLEVVLNPCLRNKEIIHMFIENLKSNKEEMCLLIEKTETTTDLQMCRNTSKEQWLTKFDFLDLHGEISPLFALIVFEHNEISTACIQTLREMKIDLSDSNLFSAVCSNGSSGLYHMFLKEDANRVLHAELVDLYPFQIVTRFNNLESLKELITLGMDVNMRAGGWTPLTFAAAIENKEESNDDLLHFSSNYHFVNLLLESGAKVDLCANDNESALYITCKRGQCSNVKLLLRHGADVNLCAANGQSPLFVACENGHDSIVAYLLEKDADVSLNSAQGASPLHVACFEGHINIVRRLLENGANVNSSAKNGFTPIMVACASEEEDESVVHLLLENGAEISKPSLDGVYPLQLACSLGNEMIVKVLLENGADVNECGGELFSPLITACYQGNETIVKLLLENHADVNKCGNEGRSPLSITCELGFYSIAQLLLDSGTNVNIGNDIHTALDLERGDIVQLLLTRTEQ